MDSLLTPLPQSPPEALTLNSQELRSSYGMKVPPNTPVPKKNWIGYMDEDKEFFGCLLCRPGMWCSKECQEEVWSQVSFGFVDNLNEVEQLDTNTTKRLLPLIKKEVYKESKPFLDAMCMPNYLDQKPPMPTSVKKTRGQAIPSNSVATQT